MKRLNLLFVLFSITSLNAITAQDLKSGITGNIGWSKVTNNMLDFPDFKNKFTLSGSLGLFAEIKIGQHSSLGIEVLWVQIEGKEVSNNREVRGFSGIPPMLGVIGIVSDKSRLHSSYVATPLYYRYDYEKLGFKIGAQPMIFLFASSDYEISGELWGEPYMENSKTKDIEFNTFDIGLKIGMDYQLNQNIRLRADYYHGELDITSDETSLERSNRQISLGVNYFFKRPD